MVEVRNFEEEEEEGGRVMGRQRRWMGWRLLEGFVGGCCPGWKCDVGEPRAGRRTCSSYHLDDRHALPLFFCNICARFRISPCISSHFFCIPVPLVSWHYLLLFNNNKIQLKKDKLNKGGVFNYDDKEMKMASHVGICTSG